MTNNRTTALLVAFIVVCGAVFAYAADRVRAGDWETTLSIAGRTVTNSQCISESDAAAMNGDANSIRVFAEGRNVKMKNGCTVKNVAIKGDQVAVTSVCAGKENVGTTTYHGDTFESVNTNGAKAQVKRVGACK
jgi:hypothetical protein